MNKADTTNIIKIPSFKETFTFFTEGGFPSFCSLKKQNHHLHLPQPSSTYTTIIHHPFISLHPNISRFSPYHFIYTYIHGYRPLTRSPLSHTHTMSSICEKQQKKQRSKKTHTYKFPSIRVFILTSNTFTNLILFNTFQHHLQLHQSEF